MGYRRRTSFLAGLTVAQISEFSLIVAALGFSLGHITAPVVGLITLVGVVTILASTYMILYSGPLYQLLSKPLKIFEKKNPQREAAESYLYDAAETAAILVGLGAYGGALAEHLLRRRKRIIAVDFDPTVLKKWRERGVSVLYGDMGDPEIHEKLPLDKTRWIVSTVRIRELNLALLQMLKNRNYRGNVALTAAAPQDAEAYEKAGIQVIFRPYLDVGEQAADALTHAMDVLRNGRLEDTVSGSAPACGIGLFGTTCEGPSPPVPVRRLHPGYNQGRPPLFRSGTEFPDLSRRSPDSDGRPGRSAPGGKGASARRLPGRLGHR
jgi:hypothetical protein